MFSREIELTEIENTIDLLLLVIRFEEACNNISEVYQLKRHLIAWHVCRGNFWMQRYYETFNSDYLSFAEKAYRYTATLLEASQKSPSSYLNHCFFAIDKEKEYQNRDDHEKYAESMREFYGRELMETEQDGSDASDHAELEVEHVVKKARRIANDEDVNMQDVEEFMEDVEIEDKESHDQINFYF